MQPEKFYADGLITVTGDAIIFHNYYFFRLSKKVPVSAVGRIEVQKPSWLNGRGRLWGTGGFGYWFPMDWGRPGRDRIFFLRRRNTKFTIGFTARDGAKAEAVFRGMGLLEPAK